MNITGDEKSEAQIFLDRLLQACGYQANADEAATINLVRRLHDDELMVCTSLNPVKELLLRRHQRWCETNGYP